MKRTVTFDAFDVGSGVTGDGTWSDAVLGVGMTGLGLLSDPVVAEDATGKYLGDGHTIMADDMGPEGPVTQVALELELEAGDLARIVLPYNELIGTLDDSDFSVGVGPFDQLQYLTVEGERTSGTQVRLSCYLNDPIVGHTHYLIARTYLTTSSSSVFFVAECGRRMARAWWFTERKRFVRQPPDIAAYLPDVECLTWGFMTSGGKVRSVSVDTEPTHARESYSVGCSGIETEEPDAVSGLGSSARAALVGYTPLRHMRRARSHTALVACGAGSTGNISEWTWRRADPQQTLCLLPAQEITMRAASLEGQLSGPAGRPVVVAAADDPQGGSDGGIGSGRTDLGPGGELVVDSSKPPDDRTTSEYGVLDEISASGGPEAYERFATRQVGAWTLSMRLRPQDARRIQKVVAAGGGARSVWVPAPFADYPLPAYIDGAEFRLMGPKRLQATIPATEA